MADSNLDIAVRIRTDLQNTFQSFNHLEKRLGGTGLAADKARGRMRRLAAAMGWRGSGHIRPEPVFPARAGVNRRRRCGCWMRCATTSWWPRSASRTATARTWGGGGTGPPTSSMSGRIACASGRPESPGGSVNCQNGPRGPFWCRLPFSVRAHRPAGGCNPDADSGRGHLRMVPGRSQPDAEVGDRGQHTQGSPHFLYQITFVTY